MQASNYETAWEFESVRFSCILLRHTPVTIRSVNVFYDESAMTDAQIVTARCSLIDANVVNTTPVHVRLFLLLHRTASVAFVSLGEQLYFQTPTDSLDYKWFHMYHVPGGWWFYFQVSDTSLFVSS